MDELAASLARFNRAEPDLLFRDAFGHSARSLELSGDFLARLEKALNLRVPTSAWWSAEYPLNALAGALLLYTEGESAIGSNRPSNANLLVKSGRQDVDFLISFETHVILIEAKVYSPNSRTQIEQKLKRLGDLKAFQEDLPNARCEAKVVRFHFLLASPCRPKKLDDVPWPTWATREDKYMWMPLDIDEKQAVLQTQRCIAKGAQSDEKDCWQIVCSKILRPRA